MQTCLIDFKLDGLFTQFTKRICLRSEFNFDSITLLLTRPTLRRLSSVISLSLITSCEAVTLNYIRRKS